MEEATKEFELSVWRPARFSRVVSYLSDTATEFDHTRLLEQIYTWNPGMLSPWTSILNGDQGRLLHDSFVERFDPHLPPDERSIHALLQFADALRTSLTDPAFASWNNVPQLATDSSDSPVMRCNLAHAFLHHLDWVIAVFINVPKASVTVR